MPTISCCGDAATDYAVEMSNHLRELNAQNAAQSQQAAPVKPDQPDDIGTIVDLYA